VTTAAPAVRHRDQGGAGDPPAAAPCVAGAALRALGTTAVVLVTAPGALGTARAILEAELAAIDAACSRFRADSELSRVNRSAGREVAVGPLLLEAVAVALAVAEQTGGAVVPTVGGAMRALGYDRDFAADLSAPPLARRPVPPASAVRLDRARGTVTVEPGVELDLGASAKALAADRAAPAAHAAAGAGVLVNLGGDIATAGDPPPGGWRVRVAEDHAAPQSAPGQTVALSGGALATSSTTVRRWADRHHIVDPATGRPTAGPWRTASVAAASAVDANAAATATIVRGADAVAGLERLRLPARLVDADGAVTTVGGWPA
jgi:thiamine biosynthesis lipoprotein